MRTALSTAGTLGHEALQPEGKENCSMPTTLALSSR